MGGGGTHGGQVHMGGEHPRYATDSTQIIVQHSNNCIITMAHSFPSFPPSGSFSYTSEAEKVVQEQVTQMSYVVVICGADQIAQFGGGG